LAIFAPKSQELRDLALQLPFACIFDLQGAFPSPGRLVVLLERALGYEWRQFSI